MRIVGGMWRGRRLAALGAGDAGAHLRPTTDRVREALFNILENGAHAGAVDGAHVLDLFAGTGALGLEALSRGADSCYFVEKGAKSAVILRKNIGLCSANEMCHLYCLDALKLPKAPGNSASLVFLDPPYGKDLGQKALGCAVARGWIAPGALVVWEEGAEQSAPEGFELLETRHFGGTLMMFLRFDVEA